MLFRSIALSKGNLPAIIGLCEIENQQVLNALCNDSPLKKGNYDYIHYNSPDIRGMDVAMIYRKDKFRVISHEKIMIDNSLIIDEPTRDILYVNGVLNKVPLHLFVVHAPSRRNNDKNKHITLILLPLLNKHLYSLLKGHTFHIAFVGMPEFKQNSQIDKISRYGNLSEREKQVASLLLQGKTYKTIAGELFISENTVKYYVKNIYSKFNIQSRAELIDMVIEK